MNSNLMIRLIDVALIILMGFIAISRIRTEYIDLPSAGESETKLHLPHEAKLVVDNSRYNFEDNGRRWSCNSLNELDKNLYYKGRNMKLVVTIQPRRSVIMQNLVNVLDICQRHQIEKNLDYENYY
ncbi:MAG: biopolymer transporter ExbD [candidate division KSB1 bacterium]|nr:biopolymer transporter ExbD [candidate division KSB1 bacterium]